MTPEKSDQSPIDPAELEMHARLEIGLIDAFPCYDAMKPPAPASTPPIRASEHTEQAGGKRSKQSSRTLIRWTDGALRRLKLF
jgi:hypothetical protein